MERRLAAIMATDVVGYSRLIRADEEGTLAALKALRANLIDPKIAEHHGRIVKLMGDGMLVEFASVVDAVRTAVETQVAVAKHNAGLPDDKRIEFRVGINLGDVVIDGDDIHGDGVNVAARLEGLAEPGGVCVSGMVYEGVRDRIDIPFEDLGEQEVKNIDRPVRVWRWAAGTSTAALNFDEKSEQRPLPDKPSIAVLPFDNMSGDPEQEYFSDGITEDIITELSRFRELHVMARNSSFFYKGQAIKVQDVGRQLGVAYIVEGSVRKAGDRVRVTVQMVEVENGTHIWAERYDRDLKDIFAVQDEITQAMVSVLPNRLENSVRERIDRKSTDSLSAYEYYLQGRWIYYNSGGENPTAVDLLNKAVETDPTFAQAYALLASIYSYNVFSLGVWYGDPEDKARACIKKALQYGENDPQIHRFVGDAYANIGDFSLGEIHLELALQLNPNDVNTMATYGWHQTYLGNAEEGLHWIEKAQQTDPLFSAFSWEAKAETLYMLRDYETSLEAFRGRLDPPPHTYAHQAACCAQLGRMEEAREAVIQFRSLCAKDMNFPRYAANHARICKRQEDADNWIEGYRRAGLLDCS